MLRIARQIEPRLGWRAQDMRDPSTWTVELTKFDHAELSAALQVAKASAPCFTEITRDRFPLDSLGDKLQKIEAELVDGRGFVLLRKLETDRYSVDELTLMFWGIGMHLGAPWPQNKDGDLITDVTDRGPAEWNPDRRDYERGGIALDYHTDGADLVGLMCLARARTGGMSCLANAIAIYNDLCEARPDLVAALHKEVPFDLRGGQPRGGKPFCMIPIFTAFRGRLFVRFVAEYVTTSQRHVDAPRLTSLVREAVDILSTMAADPAYNVYMSFEPGDVQFVNNYHILHARTAYVDAPDLGFKRHLKRLWLGTDRIGERPRHFRRSYTRHWKRREGGEIGKSIQT
jgi:hypothetical protein